jgi:hypothetical protein
VKNGEFWEQREGFAETTTILWKNGALNGKPKILTENRRF